jgi:hypothetical protein
MLQTDVSVTTFMDIIKQQLCIISVYVIYQQPNFQAVFGVGE